MFRPLALSVCLAVLVAFCDAPFVHFHEHATTEHAVSAHDGNAVAAHTHVPSRAVTPATTGPALQANPGGDDDAVFLTWVQSTSHGSPSAVVLHPAAPVVMAGTVVV